MRDKSLQQVVAILLVVACLPVLTGCCGINCCCLYLYGAVAAVIAVGAGLIGGGGDIVEAICDVVDIPGLCPDDANGLVDQQ
jgi:hypothetical protein